MKRIILIIALIYTAILSNATVYTVNVKTPGSLVLPKQLKIDKLLSNGLPNPAYIMDDSLILTGDIDIRDFLTLGLTTNNLIYIDMSNVNIHAFIYSYFVNTGHTKTIYTNDNEFPKFAFCKVFPEYATAYELSFLPGLSLTGGLILPKNITKIEDHALFCTFLPSIVIPSSVTYIAPNAIVLNDIDSAFSYTKNPFVVNYGFADDYNSILKRKTPLLYVPYGTKSDYLKITLDYYKSNIKYVRPELIVEMDGVIFSSETSISLINNSINDKVISNTNVKISSDKSWLTITSTKTGDTTNYTYNASDNPTVSERTAIVTIIANGETKNITITQPAGNPTLSVSTNSININKNANKSDINIISNTKWIATSDQSWLTLSQNVNNGDGILSVTSIANTDIKNRTANITVYTIDSLISKTITVNQDAIPTVSISKNSINFESYVSNKNSVNIISNTEWSASSNQSWLTVNKNTTNTGNDSLTFTVIENTNISLRTAIITVTATGVESQKITVTQAGKPYVSFDKNNINLSSDIINTNINIISNTEWSVVSDKSWLNVSQSVNNGNGILTISTIDSNLTDLDRTAIITIKTSIGSQTIAVTQSSKVGTPVIEVSNETLALYPNPATTSFGINNEGLATVELYSIQGTLVLSKKIMGKEAVSVSNLSAGEYVVKITTASGEVKSQKLLIQ